MLRRSCLVSLLMVVSLSSFSNAQKNELGLLLGATVLPDQTITVGSFANNNLKFSKGLTYQATYARRLVDAKVAGLYFELPFMATPNADISSGNPNPPTALASLFITPGVRLKLLPGSGISPWASIGGGYGRFDEGSTLVSGAANPGAKGTNTGVLQYGGGVDVRVFRLIGLRGEVRDFYSGHPQLNVLTANDRQHNIVVSGGLVVHF
jgi:hypothetical protein